MAVYWKHAYSALGMDLAWLQVVHACSPVQAPCSMAATHGSRPCVQTARERLVRGRCVIDAQSISSRGRRRPALHRRFTIRANTLGLQVSPAKIWRSPQPDRNTASKNPAEERTLQGVSPARPSATSPLPSITSQAVSHPQTLTCQRGARHTSAQLCHVPHSNTHLVQGSRLHAQHANRAHAQVGLLRTTGRLLAGTAAAERYPPAPRLTQLRVPMLLHYSAVCASFRGDARLRLPTPS